MKNKPLVSCIIIFLNAGEKFFIEAIESIFAQTYDNWELLLADDGSTDESTAIALRYAQQYPEKVRYVEHEGHQNRGMSATRNLGIRHAKGEYIAFLDADDVWLPHKLEQQVPILESHPEAAMLYGRTQFWFTWADNNPISWVDPESKQGDLMTITSVQFDTLVQPPTQLILFLQNKNIYPCTCSILIRRQVFEDIGRFEEDFRNAHEDMVFHSKLFLKAPVYVSSECWDRYRIHPDSYWRSADRQGKGQETIRIGHFKYLTWLEKYLSEQEIKDPNVWKALKKAIWPYRHPTLYNWIRFIQRPKPYLTMLAQQIARQVLPDQIRLWLASYIRLKALQFTTKHIYGLKKLNSSLNGLIVLCAVRNGETFIQPFIDYYFSLGAEHIIFLDNESTDNTVAIVCKYKNVTILQTKRKSSHYKPVIKNYLINKFAKNRPHIFAQVNELLDYPYRTQEQERVLSQLKHN
jgi:glycosyltransferase involved in cell wall biosynthesis